MPTWAMEGCGYMNVFEILNMRKEKICLHLYSLWKGSQVVDSCDLIYAMNYLIYTYFNPNNASRNY